MYIFLESNNNVLNCLLKDLEENRRDDIMNLTK